MRNGTNTYAHFSRITMLTSGVYEMAFRLLAHVNYKFGLLWKYLA